MKFWLDILGWLIVAVFVLLLLAYLIPKIL